MRFHLRRRIRDQQRWPAFDADEAAWIVAWRRPFADGTVGSLVPVAFERYARVLHPATAAADVPVRWDTVAAWSGRSIHALAQWERVSRSAGGARGTSPFVQPPDAGGLLPRELALLCDVLAAHTSTPDRCFIGTWDGYGSLDAADPDSVSELRLDQRTFLVRRGSIETPARGDWLDPGRTLRPEPRALIWPADHAWFVAGDVDLDSSYVGGSADLVAAILAQPALEAWPVAATDDVTAASDAVNEP
jgi:hypothetical protein